MIYQHGKVIGYSLVNGQLHHPLVLMMMIYVDMLNHNLLHLKEQLVDGHIGHGNFIEFI